MMRAHEVGGAARQAKLFLSALVLFIATIIWVPVNPLPIAFGRSYFRADLLADPTLRALPGTVASLLGLSPRQFVYAILLFQLCWLFLLLVGLDRGAKPAARSRPPAGTVCLAITRARPATQRLPSVTGREISSPCRSSWVRKK